MAFTKLRASLQVSPPIAIYMSAASLRCAILCTAMMVACGPGVSGSPNPLENQLITITLFYAFFFLWVPASAIGYAIGAIVFAIIRGSHELRTGAMYGAKLAIWMGAIAACAGTISAHFWRRFDPQSSDQAFWPGVALVAVVGVLMVVKKAVQKSGD